MTAKTTSNDEKAKKLQKAVEKAQDKAKKIKFPKPQSRPKTDILPKKGDGILYNQTLFSVQSIDKIGQSFRVKLVKPSAETMTKTNYLLERLQDYLEVKILQYPVHQKAIGQKLHHFFKRNPGLDKPETLDLLATNSAPEEFAQLEGFAVLYNEICNFVDHLDQQPTTETKQEKKSE